MEKKFVNYNKACMAILEIGQYLGLNTNQQSLILATIFGTYPEDDYFTLKRMEEAKEIILK